MWEKEEDVQLEELGSGGAGAADLLLLGGGGGKGMAMSDVCIVVDSGFSFTHILPFYQGRALHKSVRAGCCGPPVLYTPDLILNMVLNRLS